MAAVEQVEVLGFIEDAADTLLAVTGAVGTIREMGYSVCLGIEVKNLTKFHLTEPITRTYRGYVNSPPPGIPPGTKGTMAVRKTGIVWAGSYGTVSWKVATGDPQADRRVVVMWGMPYNHNHTYNELAVGLTNPGETKHREGNVWLNLMRKDKEPPTESNAEDRAVAMSSLSESTKPLSYKRGAYYSNMEEIVQDDDKFEVIGYMGSSHQTDANIIFRPKLTNEKVSPAYTREERDKTQRLNKDRKSLKVILADYAPCIKKYVLERAES
ncbi:tereporin-Ca1-like [Amphiura filiformis]|uniref:tereporin-Ca1-like n=1 Tax=Amphiura filiformis TaxID=82378 RepID=UPI003B223C44